jgi:phage terminase Nu1 subunit (DNA packaging protein)
MRVTAEQLAEWYDVERRTITNWLNATPPCPSKKHGRERTFDSAAVAKWREDRAAATAEEAALARFPGSAEWETARTRKMAAEAGRAELALATERGELGSVEDFRQVLRQGFSRIRAQLLSIPGRYAVRTIGLKTLPESQQAWDSAIRDVLVELREGKSPGVSTPDEAA